MKQLLNLVTAGLALAALVVLAQAKDPTRVLESGQAPQDRRLGPPKTLDDYFPFAPPAGKKAWEARRKELREQMLVALGLWPMPEKTPLRPVIHGKIDREGYTIEKVFFASYPGHYVSGNLYRPKGKPGKRAGVLCPHGHWPQGRFFERSETEARAQISKGAEKTLAGARYPLQARCAQLARMGCVVFHYDMVGNADSRQIKHTEGFTDARAELRQQSFMGLQAFNSIRALDFLLRLPDVDPKRVGVTGASGGGTQTFILCALDDRPAAAFPAVMVSTAMQGGCVCENCSYLRIGTGNVEFAGLFAPKPLGMTGADDWTKDIEARGLPELKTLYKLYGAEDKVMAKCFPQFEHNYNQVSREVMYNWFNKHLHLGQKEPVTEKPFVPVPPRELSVYDKDHPLPDDAVGAEKLRQFMARRSDRQMAALYPRDAARWKGFRRVVGTALRIMIADQIPAAADVEDQPVGNPAKADGITWRKLFLSRKGQKEQLPAVELRDREWNGTVVVWIHPEGKATVLEKGKLVPGSLPWGILDKKAAILAVDVFRTGELQNGKMPQVNKTYAGFTFGYNRPLLAQRVHDILTAVAYARSAKGTKKVYLAGFGKAGPWVVLARALCGDAVARTVADLNQFRFDKVTSTADEMMLPGAVKYGGLPAFAALCAPGELYLHNERDTGVEAMALAAFKAAGAAPGAIRLAPTQEGRALVLGWLLR
jgi:dienelactone hydrolase